MTYYRVHVASGHDATARAERIVTTIWTTIADQDAGATAYAAATEVWFRGTKAAGYDLLLSRTAWTILREREQRDFDQFTRQAMVSGSMQGLPPAQTTAEPVHDPDFGEYSRIRF